MTTENFGELLRVRDAGETVADPDDDIRGRTIIDKDGAGLGKVAALLIDEKDRKVRFLEVESGGFLGLGEKKAFIPVEAITAITAHEVRIDHTGQQVAGAPNYDPALAQKRKFYETTYGYYGYMPYWGMGYTYPAYPQYHTGD
jgi:sporulation protein YlmC with PRC-barrel domain